MRKRPTRCCRRRRSRSRSQVCSREEQLHVTLEPRHRPNDQPTDRIWNSTSKGKARHAMIFCVNKAFLVKINKARAAATRLRCSFIPFAGFGGVCGEIVGSTPEGDQSAWMSKGGNMCDREAYLVLAANQQE